MLQDSNTQRKGPDHLLVAEGMIIVAAQFFRLVIKLDMHAVAKLAETMQVVVDGSAKAVEKLASLHCLNNVVEAFDLGFTNLLQIVGRNVGNAFLRVIFCTINDLIERSFNDRTCLNDHELVKRLVLVRGAQTTQRFGIRNDVVADLEVADEVAPDCFDVCCQAVTSEKGIKKRRDNLTPR